MLVMTHKLVKPAEARSRVSAVSGNALATGLAVAAGLAGSVQVALMSRLGERIGVLGALAFSTALTAVIALLILVIARGSLGAFSRAVHQPWWMLLGGVMGLLIVFTVTYSGPRIGVAATVGILIAGQLAMGAAIDRWGLFGSERIALHWPRVIGIGLLAVGAALSLRK
jgi:transporter family-2 protein